MKNYLSFTFWGLVAFFVATFLFIFIFFATTQNEEVEEGPSTEESVDEEPSDDELNEASSDEASND